MNHVNVKKTYVRPRDVCFAHNVFAWLGGAPSPGNATNHNHATAATGGTVTGSGGSNFKRQNTVDAATIKENSARVSASRPSAPKNSPGQLDTSELFFLVSRNSYLLCFL